MLNRLPRLLPALLVMAVAAAGGPSAALEPERAGSLRRALAAADGGDWSGAARLADQAGDPLADALIEWRRLLDARGIAFADYRRFLAQHPDWPRQRELRRRAEEALGDREDAKAVRAFFADAAPVTAPGRIRYAEALIAGGDRAAAKPLLRAAWREGRFAANDEKTFLIRHATALDRDDHVARLDYMLWSRAHAEARRMRGRVPPDVWLLAEARLALQTKAPGVDGAIARVPANLRSDAGLAFDRVRWRRDRELWDGAAELLLARPQVNGWRARWWEERQFQIRRALAARNWQRAYVLASGHEQTEGADFAEAEFLAGWIALRFLDRPQDASRHFERLWHGVGRPVSLSRAAYWAGRAAEAQGDAAGARAWYGRAAEHHIAFYGQLALAELGRPLPPPQPQPDPSAAARRAFEAESAVRVTRMLILAGETGLIDDFVLHLDQRTQDTEALALSVELAQAADRPDLVLDLGKRAGWRSVVLETAAFPIPQVPGLDLVTRDGVPPELVLALARQESQFRPAARSHAGATGLLQVMPATAKGVARRIGLPYDQRRLSSDPDYNLRIGRAYIRWQLESFGELPLALAAYNAGPARVSQWLKTFGDPRRGQIDELDWIELIPFDETRNYVHRVLEGRAVYRHILANRSAAVVPRLAPAALRDPPLPSEKPREGT